MVTKAHTGNILHSYMCVLFSFLAGGCSAYSTKQYIPSFGACCVLGFKLYYYILIIILYYTFAVVCACSGFGLVFGFFFSFPVIAVQREQRTFLSCYDLLEEMHDVSCPAPDCCEKSSLSHEGQSAWDAPVRLTSVTSEETLPSPPGNCPKPWSPALLALQTLFYKEVLSFS